ncbi:MAG: hypothetical protein LQ347_002250, partial [Umbilicaria vellea]
DSDTVSTITPPNPEALKLFRLPAKQLNGNSFPTLLSPYAMSLSESSHTPPLGAKIYQLKIKPIFDALEKREKFYAHYLARAAWHGSRIIMRQVSSESLNIFDFIMDLYHACDGKWDTLIAQCNITSEELVSFLEFAAMFLCNLGNFYGEGDQEFVPDVTAEALRKIAEISPKTRAGLDNIIDPLLVLPPISFGYLSKNAQSSYYPSDEPITRDEIAKVSEVMNKKSIGLENTRVQKVVKDGKPILQLLQASAAIGPLKDGHNELADEKAKEYAGNDKQTQFLTHYTGWNPFRGVNDGKGPLEKSSFEAPDFTSVHALTVCGSIVFEAVNVPNETSPGTYNFDKQNPPISPLSGEVVVSHYLPGQMWGSVFGKLAGTVEECRAILMSEYFMDNKDLLGIFGYTNNSNVTAEDLLYTTYLNIGVDGLQALEHYNFQDQVWGQVHHQLHIWRCTADVSACGKFYEPMCAVDGVYEEWRKIVVSKPTMRWKFVQPNTFVEGGNIEVKVCEESNGGIIQS